ncbi:MAG: sugar ABC transporter substrate-binding protein [Caldilinea sp.]|nr:sugar ABC transporter substrate-binding protein [Caldilinea sp.]MDW8439288.1 sugar ABC transporter substrate-binding protein [Caldilineaceae bacterium]
MRGPITVILPFLFALLFAACAQPVPFSAPTQPAATAEPTQAASTPAGGSVTIRFGWWGNDERAARTQKVIELFQAAYPEIQVMGEPNGGTADHFQIINTQLAANNAPDLIQLGGNWPDYQQYLEPLNDYLGKQLLIDTPERFDQTALIPATRDGSLWCVSLGTNTLILAYNKTMIEAAGAELPKDLMTWDELLDYGRQLKAKLPQGVYPFVDNSTNTANYLSFFFQQQGTPIWTLDEGGKSYATVESARKWFQMWADMRAEGLIPDADTTATFGETGADNSALVAGKAAIGLIWSNQLAGYQAAMTDQLGAITLPRGGENAYAIQMSQCIGINKASSHKEEAALFINFFVTDPEAGAVLGTNRGVPSSPVVRTAIADQSTEADAAVYRIYNAIADQMVPQGPNLPNDQEFVNELRLLGQSLAYGEVTVDEAAEQLIALIRRLSAK